MAKFADRFLLVVYSFVVGVALMLLLAMAFNWIGFSYAVRYLENLYREPAVAYPFIALGILFLLFSILLFILGLRNPARTVRSIDRRTDYGLVRVSFQTLQNLAAGAAADIPGIHDLKTRIRAGENGIDIDLRANVDGQTALPELTEQLQSKVKHHVERMSGLTVASVTVLIEKAAPAQAAPPLFKSRVE